MHPVKSIAAAIALFALLVQSAPTMAASPQPTIYWLVWELSPEFIKKGDWAGKGYADKFLEYFTKHLPGYDHVIQWTNVRRWSQEALRPNRCSSHLWGHFYRDQLVYSKAYTFTPPHTLIFHKRFQEQLGPPGSVVSIAELLENPDLRLVTLPLFPNGKNKEARYPILRDYLEPHLDKPNYIQFGGLANEVNLLFLEKDRADYTIGYPSTVTAQVRSKGIQDNFIYYRIKEHQRYKKIYVACYGDAFGKQVIAKINAALTKEALSEFIDYHEEWNQRDPEFRRASEAFFLHGKTLDNVVD